MGIHGSDRSPKYLKVLGRLPKSRWTAIGRTQDSSQYSSRTLSKEVHGGILRRERSPISKKLDRGSIRSSPRYGSGPPTRLTLVQLWELGLGTDLWIGTHFGSYSAKCRVGPAKSKCRSGPAKCRGGPAKCRGGPAKCRGSPARCRGGPAECRGGPAKCRGGPAKCKSSPAKYKGGPAKCRGGPAKFNSYLWVAQPAICMAQPAIWWGGGP